MSGNIRELIDVGRPLAAVHIDLDGARHIYRAHGWTYHASDDRLFETGLETALEVLEEAGVRATLFVIAEDLADPVKRRLLHSAVQAGHEIASHSVTHRVLTSLSSDDKREEITTSRARLAADLSTEVSGFRAPRFGIDRESLEMLADAGYTYDSSMFAGKSPHPDSTGPHHPIPGAALIELPVPAFWSLPFHPSYSLVVGNWYFSVGVRGFRRTNSPFVLLFHLTDFAEPLQSARHDGWNHRLFTLSYLSRERKRARCAAMLQMVQSQFDVTTTARILEMRRTRAAY